jgi:hypothetical protein
MNNDDGGGVENSRASPSRLEQGETTKKETRGGNADAVIFICEAARMGI